jgi:hypothetical protein
LAQPAPTLGNKIIKFNPVTHVSTVIRTPPPASSPGDLNNEDPNAIYVGELTANTVGRISI